MTVWLERARPARSEVYNRLDIQIAELWTRLGGLPSPMEAAGDLEGHLDRRKRTIQRRLEGNTLVIREVEQKPRPVKAAPSVRSNSANMWRSRATPTRLIGSTGKAFSPTSYDPERHITMQDVRHVHQQVMALVWDVEATSRRHAP